MADRSETRAAISEFRRLAGLTWEQLARVFGVSRRSLPGRVASRSMPPTRSTCDDFSQCSGKPIEEAPRRTEGFYCTSKTASSRSTSWPRGGTTSSSNSLARVRVGGTSN